MKYLTTTIHEFIKERILYLDLTVSKSTGKFCKELCKKRKIIKK